MAKGKRNRHGKGVTISGRKFKACKIVKPKGKRSYAICSNPPAKKKKKSKPYKVAHYGGRKAHRRTAKYLRDKKRFGHELDG